MTTTPTTPTGTPPPARDEPALLRLPTELLLDILSQLSYKELQRVRRVCKKLQGLVADKHFDPILFRQKPPHGFLSEGTTFKLHPILKLVEGIFWEPQMAVIKLWNSDGEEDELNANDYKQTGTEYATSPACKTMCLVLHVWGEIDLVIEDEKGITVKYFLEQLSEFWCGDPLPEGVSDTRPDWQRSKASDWLGDHRFWNGWEPAFVREDGAIQLDAMYYDS